MPEPVTGYEHKFRRAIKSSAKPLIGLYGLSGTGKTFSSLLMARGFAGASGRVGMIETESGRGEAFVDMIPGGYDVLSISEDYSPRIYGEALTAAEKADLSSLIIDSASHEWESYGGVLHMAALNEEAGKKGQLVWKQPKMDHERHFMQRVRSTAIPLVIVCMRAKYPMREVRVDGKKEWVRSDELQPKQSDDILSEMFVHGWIDAEHQFHGTKYTTPEWRDIIRDGEPISIETGQRIAAWARGGEPAKTAPTAPAGSEQAPLLTDLTDALKKYGLDGQGEHEKKARQDMLDSIFGTRGWAAITKLAPEQLRAGLVELRHRNEPPE